MLCPQDPTMACTGTYTIGQTDVDNGSINNTGQVTALSPKEDAIGASNDDIVVLTGTVNVTLGEKILVFDRWRGSARPWKWRGSRLYVVPY